MSRFRTDPTDPDAFTMREIEWASALLMTGENAQPPRWKRVRRVLQALRRGVEYRGKKGHVLITATQARALKKHFAGLQQNIEPTVQYEGDANV